MQRRAALKNLALAMGGLISLPAWASGWTPASLDGNATLPVDEQNLLAQIVEAIIPETNTPGAKSLQVHQFVMRMINDCYEKPAQELLKNGLKETERTATQLHAQSFMVCNPTQQQVVLTTMSQATDPNARQFVEIVKQLTIQGYLNSEYVLVHLLKYNMAPGFYHGCVPVKT